MNKVAWSIVAGVLVLIVLAVVIVGFFLDGIVKKGVEIVGPKIAQVSVKVDAVNLSLLTGSAAVKGLVVGNPDGYKTPEAISIGSASVGVDPFSVLSKKIHIRSIQVQSPEITFEGGLGGNNLSKILDNLNAANKEQVQQSANTNQTATAKGGKMLQVDDFLITGAKVHGTLISFGGKEITIPTLPLPDIHLTDLGKGDEGITATDLSRRVMEAIFSATIKAVSSSATDLGNGAGKAATEGMKNIGSSIGNLFGK